MKIEYINVSEFSRRLKIDRVKIQNSLDRGDIKKHKDPKTKKLLIKWPDTKKKFLSLQKKPKIRTSMKDKSTRETKKNLFAISKEDLTYQQALELKAIIQAKTAQIDYEQAERNVVSLDLVDKIFADIAVEIRTSFNDLPDRICDLLGEGITYNERHDIITREKNRCLSFLSKKIVEEIKLVIPKNKKYKYKKKN